MNQDLDKIVAYSKSVLSLNEAKLSEGYFYRSLPLCVIDAVFSINVRYEGVRNTVERYCRYFDLPIYRESRDFLPPIDAQETISSFCGRVEGFDFENLARKVLGNTQRTSPRGGILKAEATCLFADALKRHGVECFQDVHKVRHSTEFEREIFVIAGQGAGVSLKYFFMLAGEDDLIKPDRMIESFLIKALGRKASSTEAQDLLFQAASQLQTEFPLLTARLLDHQIWQHERPKMRRGTRVSVNTDRSSRLQRKTASSSARTSRIAEDIALQRFWEFHRADRSKTVGIGQDEKNKIITLMVSGVSVEEAIANVRNNH